MRKLLLLFCTIICAAEFSYAQKTVKSRQELPVVYISDDLSIHFTSPEPIQYVDISTHKIAGDLPVKNVLRIKALKDSLSTVDYGWINRDVAVLTIVGEKYMAQYNVRYVDDPESKNINTNIQITPDDMTPLDNADITMGENDMHQFALDAIKNKRSFHSVSSKAYGIQAKLNNIFTVDDYVFVDVTYHNSTNLKYDIDEIRFKIDDKKITKSTNVQSVEVKPVYTLYENNAFKRKFRNVFVFKKFTFPGNKIFNIEMTEKQISGRIITLQLDYSDLLNADTL